MDVFGKSIGDLLRHAVSGGVFLAWLAFLQTGNLHPTGDVRALAIESPTSATLTALVVGSVIYALHRGAVYWLIELWLTRLVMGGNRHSWRRVCQRVRIRDDRRWQRSVPTHPCFYAQSGLARWGDLVHFGYCSALAVALACLWAWCTGVECGGGCFAGSASLVVVLLVSTVCANRRLIEVDSWYALRRRCCAAVATTQSSTASDSA